MKPIAPAPANLEPTEEVLKILEVYLEELEQGNRRQPEDLIAEHPDLAEPLRACLASLDLLHDAALSMRGLGAGARPAPKERLDQNRQLGDFKIRREVGRGGMGVVYEADQISLGRRVALKVLPTAAAMDAKQLQRFKIEAQAAAHLRHPNIVAVHAVGCEEGVHYYAMQFIDGQSLADWIRELRRLEGRDPVDLQMNVATPATNAQAPTEKSAAQQTRASSYAGIPALQPDAAFDSNRTMICRPYYSLRNPAFYQLVGQLGIQAAEALEHAHSHGVLHRDIKPANLLVDDRGNLWVTDFGLARFQDDVGLTMSGDLLGTIRYMSPEQALAKRGLVDHRADIYSLGVTLYELVTLDPAFVGRDRQELLRQIAFDEPTLPRRLNPEIPDDLEIILCKAIAKNPEDRYDSALALAEDLRRYLEDRPILAKRPTVLQRIGRQCKRHQQLVAVAVGVALLIAVGSAFASALVWRAKGQTEIALKAEADHRHRAEENLTLSLQTIEDLYLQVVERRFALNQQSEEDRRLLQKALDFYEKFARRNGDDQAARTQIAKAYRRVGDIYKKLGQHQEAVTAYGQAIYLLEMQSASRPYTADERWELATCHKQLSTVLAALGRSNEALQTMRVAMVMFEVLATSEPQHFDYRKELGDCHNALGQMYQKMGQGREAEKVIRQALVLDQKLADDFRDLSQGRYQLARTHHNHAQLLESAGRLKEAEAAYRKTLVVLEELAAIYPETPDYRFRLATSRSNLAGLLNITGKRAEAEDLYKEALEVQEKLVQETPRFFDGIRDLAVTQRSLATLLQDQGRMAEAEKYYRQSLRYLDKLARDFPMVPSYGQDLTVSLNNLGNFFMKNRQPMEAEKAFRQALDMLEQLTQSFREPEYRQELAACHNNLGLLYESLNRIKEAEKEYRDALATFDQLPRPTVALPDYQSNRGSTLGNLAKLLMECGQLEEARDLAYQAVELQSSALKANPQHQTFRSYLQKHYSVLGETLWRMRRHQEVAQVAAVWAGMKGEQWINCYEAAALLARCVVLAEQDMAYPGSDGKALAEGYSQHVRELLKRAQDRSRNEAGALRTLAWFHLTCPETRFRDAEQARLLAANAVMRQPRNGDNWNVLALALVRQGRSSQALSAARAAMELHEREESSDCFVLALAHWFCGNKSEACSSYLRGVSAQREHRLEEEDLLRLQSETAATLGMAFQPRSRKSEPLPID